MVKPLDADRLCLKTDPARLPFETTGNLTPANAPVGQERAMRALSFGARMAQPGYNIFVTGPQGSGRRAAVKGALAKMAAAMPAPSDWCYVHNFAAPHRPLPIKLPAGQGAAFKTAMGDFVESLQTAMPKLFESDDYRRRRGVIEDEFRQTVQSALDRLRKAAEEQGLALVERDEGGFDFLPQRDGLVLSDEDYRRLPKPDREKLNARAQAMRSELDRTMQQLGTVREKAVEKLRALDRELGEGVVRGLMRPLADRFGANREIAAHVEAVFQDVMEHVEVLQALATDDGSDAQGERDDEVPFHRYEVNLLVDNAALKGAPVVSLALPSLSNLVGKVEHVPVLMSYITDFMFIRAGSLHKANGGFLLIDALDLLQTDVSWETLKRTLREARIKIENLAEILDRSNTVSIQPEPIPLDIKIVLIGEAWLFYRLRELDPEFAELFKVQADFSTSADRDDANCGALLRLMSSVARSDGLKQFDRTGAARLIDEAARMAGDAEKISVRTSRLADLMREADHFAGEAGRSLISAPDIGRAVAAKEDRGGRLKALEQELIKRNILFIDTDGAKAGQVNGLTVLSASGFAFGMPARITAAVRPGNGRVTDIERLAEFSGPTHIKGVQILSGYLNGHYSLSRPLSLSASVAFEQSYGPIDGDSASTGELIAILSAIADVPLKQGIAITGSINQRGQIQPIGGANEKIEGFFDVCAARGLTKQHGVIIPKANVINLMLRDDVVEAARKGRFAIYAVEHVDEAIEILSGMKAGKRRDGGFPRGTFNRRVAERLTYFARPRILRPIRLDGWWPF
ncbi:MAG TPA: ATP-binding protein [Rhizomicrobium sp.]|jgi:lon-related putative ATP-dependent protease|nr:ATP-binding protein [Rhizomicrobium sp.]